MENPSLLDKLLGRPFVAIKEVLGKNIEFRILTQTERVEIWKKLPTTNIMVAPEAIAIPTLSLAIVSIDGVLWERFSEIIDYRSQKQGTTVEEAVEHYLSKIPYPVIMRLYEAYVELIDSYQTNLDTLKKSSTTVVPEPSGKSAKPSAKTP